MIWVYCSICGADIFKGLEMPSIIEMCCEPGAWKVDMTKEARKRIDDTAYAR